MQGNWASPIEYKPRRKELKKAYQKKNGNDDNKKMVGEDEVDDGEAS